MPQELQVVRCFSCNTYQVEIVKKSKKWNCKICTKQQSFKQIFYKGTGKECRLYVQQLNETRMTNDINLNASNSENEEVQEIKTFDSINTTEVRQTTTNESKWNKYLEKPIDNNHLMDNDKNSEGNVQYVLEMPVKKRKTNFKQSPFNKFKRHNKNKNNMKETLCNSGDFVDEEQRKEVLPIISSQNNIQETLNSEDVFTKPNVPNKSQVLDEKKITYKPPPVSANSKWSKFITNSNEGDLKNNDLQTDDLKENTITQEKLFEDEEDSWDKILQI